MERLCAIDLFAGGGGLALGIHQAGFVHLALIEINRYACESLELNGDIGLVAPRWPVFQRDVREFDYQTVLGDNLPTACNGELDLLAAGAPCQPFSLGGEHAGEGDDRNMFPFVFQAIRALRPRVIVIENVHGLRRPNFRPYYEHILLQLEMPFIPPKDGEDWTTHKLRLLRERPHLEHFDRSETYHYQEKVLNSADYGTPQRRERLIIVAFRRDLPLHWEFPLGGHSESRLLHDQYVSGDYWTWHRLPRRKPPEHLAERVRRLTSSTSQGKPWRTLRDAIQGLPEPVEGVAAEGWDFHVGIPNARLYRSHTGNDLDRPAKTIKAGSHGNPGGEHIIRRDDGSIRYMTVRECARVQDFPDGYRFAGSRSQAIRQIGNAVPVRLAEVLGRSIRCALEEASSSATARVTERAPSVFVEEDLSSAKLVGRERSGVAGSVTAVGASASMQVF